MDLTSSVLANPGAPVMRQCPPANSAIRICSITSCCPTMTLPNSASIRVLPVESRSTVSASVAAGKGGGVGMDSDVRLIDAVSVGHGVKNYVNGQRVSDFLGEMFEVVMIVALPLPSVPVVGIARGKAHDAALVVENHPMMRNTAAFFRRVIVGIKLLPAAVSLVRHSLFAFNVENAMVKRMLDWQFHPVAVRKNLFQLLCHAFPFLFTPEIVQPQKAAIQQIFAQNFDLRVVEVKTSRFHHVDERIVRQFLVGQMKEAPVRIYFQGGQS